VLGNLGGGIYPKGRKNCPEVGATLEETVLTWKGWRMEGGGGLVSCFKYWKGGKRKLRFKQSLMGGAQECRRGAFPVGTRESGRQSGTGEHNLKPAGATRKAQIHREKERKMVLLVKRCEMRSSGRLYVGGQKGRVNLEGDRVLLGAGKKHSRTNSLFLEKAGSLCTKKAPLARVG